MGAWIGDVAPEAQAALIERLVARATVATPNLPEARALAGDDEEELSPGELARTVHALGPQVVVVTGGHGEDGSDLFFDGARLVEVPGERHPDGAAHGSGCTHSHRAPRAGRPPPPWGASSLAVRAGREPGRRGWCSF